MKTRFSILLTVIAIASVIVFFVTEKNRSVFQAPPEVNAPETEEQEERFTELRGKYDFDMVKDPATGKIPFGIYEQELALAKTIPEKGFDLNNASRIEALNTYYPAGPNNQGGRTRAVAYDIRYNGTSNRVLIAGGVSGGIMRSADAGANWTRVSPDGEIHNLSCLAQDPRPGSQDIWYAGGGEYNGSSTDEIGAVYFGFGLYKSTNNGVSWTRLPLAATDINGAALAAGVLETFDNAYDYVHKIIINPTNGDVYVGGHRRLLRSTNGGTSFNAVFSNPAAPAFASNGQLDVICSPTGKFFLAVSGANPDLALRGVWTSATGNANSWTRIAGGSVLGVDSVANWRANSYKFTSSANGDLYESKRILLTMAPSNENIIYVFYENGLVNVAPDNAPEADLYKLNTTGGTNTWTNLSANMPDFPGSHAATDPFAVQGGYDMCITVKPDNPNFVLIGGSSLYRSTDGFASTANTSWIGGYGNTLPTLSTYPGSHPDIHLAVFNPSNINEVLCANDGGIQKTADINASGSNVTWAAVSNYQTLQYFNVSIDPGTGRNNFVGGAQDNGTQFRDKMQLFGTPLSDSNNHIRILGGDGTTCGIGPLTTEQYIYASFQLGNLRRLKLSTSSPATDNITPNNNLTTTGTAGEFGDFVTNFRLDPDNTEDLYYVNYNRLFRTTSASTVSPGTWTELNTVGTTIDPDGTTNGINVIRGTGISRGPYTTSHVLYLGTTNGKIFRIDNPRNITNTYPPINITPPGNTGNVQDIAVNPNNDDEILAVVSNYGVPSIWWTNNAKSSTPTWRNAEGNLPLPSFRSAAIVVKKDASNNPVTEYYVGTSVGLYSAVNIGTTLTAGGTPTWQREGGSVLNFAVVVSLAYRPVDNVLLIGTHGNGMYYTFLGTPNFTPNLNTGINDPTINDKNFIRTVYPTIGSDPIQYRIGNMFAIKKISVQLFNMSGQQVWHSETNYQDGSIEISKLSRGAYILSIYSDDKKYRHLQKIIKQ
jgi:hypothetical protein